jgi:hypothetical protein
MSDGDGGAHTNFNAQAFATGAVGAASLLASAAVAGVANLAAQRRHQWADWSREMVEWECMLEHRLRVHHQREAEAAKEELAKLRLIMQMERARR